MCSTIGRARAELLFTRWCHPADRSAWSDLSNMLLHISFKFAIPALIHLNILQFFLARKSMATNELSKLQER